MPVYVVFAPETIRGIYPTWPACEAKVTGVRGATFQKAPSQAAAEAMLSGETLRLLPGLYVAIDGNHLGGLGCVFSHHGDGVAATTREYATTLAALFPAGIPVSGGPAIPASQALAALRNIAAELGALALALQHAPRGQALTVVHDYEGIGAWMTGRWQAHEPIVRALLAECRRRIDAGNLTVTYRHQRGHQADPLGLNPLVRANQRADALATAAITSAPAAAH